MQREQSDEFTDDDVAMSIASLESDRFRPRTLASVCQSDDPPEAATIAGRSRRELTRFEGELEGVELGGLQTTLLRRSTDELRLVMAGNRWSDYLAGPTPADLLHVYGPDVDDTKDWRRFYRWAWKQLDPPTGHGIIFSSDAQIIREGRLGANSFAYSGQSSTAICGAGIFFRPRFGDCFIDVRPYVRWATLASLTGAGGAGAGVTASIGIFVESWDAASGGGRMVERDVFIPVFSQSGGHIVRGVEHDGAVSVADGLVTTGLLAVTQRRYAIFVYVFLEASAAGGGGDLRFATVDINAQVPYVVVQETLF